MSAIGDYLLYGVPYQRSSTYLMPTPTNPGSASARTAVTILLTNDETAFLDEVTAEIRRRTGASISRSAMLRAMLSALRPYHPEWLRCGSEAELNDRISRRLQNGGAVANQQAGRAQAK